MNTTERVWSDKNVRKLYSRYIYHRDRERLYRKRLAAGVDLATGVPPEKILEGQHLLSVQARLHYELVRAIALTDMEGIVESLQALYDLRGRWAAFLTDDDEGRKHLATFDAGLNHLTQGIKDELASLVNLYGDKAGQNTGQ